MNTKYIEHEISKIIEYMRCLWVIDDDVESLNTTIAFLDSIDIDFTTDEALKIILLQIKTNLEKLNIHPDEEGEWINLKSLVIKDLDKLIEDGKFK